MAFTYAAFADTETDPTADIVPMTPANVHPALILWLAVSLNTRNQYSLTSGTPNPVNDDDKNQLAQALGVTRNTVDQFFALADVKSGFGGAFADTAVPVFESLIANPPGVDPYSHVGCPTDITPFLELAKHGVNVPPAAVILADSAIPAGLTAGNGEADE